MKKILSTQCKNKVHTSCDGYLEYFPHLKGYKCNCECHSVKKVTPTPPVNESWQEFEKKYSISKKYHDCEQIIYMAFESGQELSKSLLSTARQEAKSKERESLLFTFETFLLNSPLREKWIEFSKQLKPIDSLTSKGGV